VLEVDKSRLGVEVIEADKRARIEEAKKFAIEREKLEEAM